MITAIYNRPDSATLVSGIEYEIDILPDGNAVTIVGADGYKRYYPIDHFIIQPSNPEPVTSATQRTFVKNGQTFIEVTMVHTFAI